MSVTSINNKTTETKRQRFVTFEFELRNLFVGLESEITIEDYILLDEVKQSILAFILMNEVVSNNDKILLDNCRTEIYENLNELQKRHNDICINKILQFMRDYYFSNQED